MSEPLCVIRERYRDALHRQELAWARHKSCLEAFDIAGAEAAFADAQRFHDEAQAIHESLTMSAPLGKP